MRPVRPVTTGEMYLQQTNLTQAQAQLEELNTRCAGSTPSLHPLTKSSVRVSQSLVSARG
jgi:hypothetical protein